MQICQHRSYRYLALLAILAAIPAVWAQPPQVSPHVSQVFGAPTIPVGGTTTLTFTVTNTITAFTITGIRLEDALSPGLVVASPNGLTGNCGGTVEAVAGTNEIRLEGGMLAAVPPTQTCAFSINVTGTAIGPQYTYLLLLESSASAAVFVRTATLIGVTAALPATPAPASWLLLGIGMLAILGWNWWQFRLRRQR
jgi:uncharacterized repeat protein (TIGR01451 family)